jgi:hypothetical protein
MKKEMILVVEDDKAILTGLVDLLESEGYAVRPAENGKDALRLHETEKPTLILLDISAGNLAENYKEAGNIIRQAFEREEKTLESTAFFVAGDVVFTNHLKGFTRNLAAQKLLSLADLENQYKALAALQGVKPLPPSISFEEKRLSLLVPKRTADMKGYFDRRAFVEKIKGKNIPEYKLMSNEDFEIRNFIDDRRSILEIRDAVSAEFRPIPLIDIENYIKVLEIGGMVTIEKKTR